MRAANGSPITANTLVRSLLRFEGVQLHLGLRVLDFSTDVLLGHPFLQKHNPIIDWTARIMCLSVRNRTHVVRAVDAPPSSVFLTPLLAYALAFFVLTPRTLNHVHVHPYQFHAYLLLGMLVIPCPRPKP